MPTFTVDVRAFDVATPVVAFNPLNALVQSFAVSTPTVNLIRPWTPAQITTALWLESSRTSSLTLSGADVVTWNDLSGNARSPTQGTSGNRPNRIVAGLNGLNTVEFNGTTDRLAYTTATALLRDVGRALIFAVYKHDVVPTTNRAALYIATATSTNSRFYFRSTTVAEYQSLGRRDDALAADYVISDLLADTGWHIHEAAVDYINAQLYQYIDGEYDSWPEEFADAGRTSNTNSTNLTIGAISSTPTNFLDGSIAEIIVVHENASDTLRRIIEGYLAWKWGLQDNLPVDHIYKSAPPANTVTSGMYTFTVTVPAPTFTVGLPSTIGFLEGEAIPVVAAPVVVATQFVHLKANGVHTLYVQPVAIQVTSQVLNLTSNSVLWTPAMTLPDLWYDFSDAANYTVVSGAYSKVQDKSVGGRELSQFDLTFRPSWIDNGQNGLDVARFDDVDPEDFMTFPPLPQVSGQQIFFAGDTALIGTAYRMLLQRQTNGPAAYFGRTSADRRPTLYWGADRATYGSAVVGPAIFRWGFTTGATASATVEVNAQNAVTTTFAGGALTLDNWVGINRGDTQISDFEAFELIILPASVAKQTTIDQIYGYLAWKWGLQASLPANHPYKNGPPTQPLTVDVPTALAINFAPQTFSFKAYKRVNVTARAFSVASQNPSLWTTQLYPVAITVGTPTTPKLRAVRRLNVLVYAASITPTTTVSLNYLNRIMVDVEVFAIEVYEVGLRHLAQLPVEDEAFDVAPSDVGVRAVRHFGVSTVWTYVDAQLVDLRESETGYFPVSARAVYVLPTDGLLSRRLVLPVVDEAIDVDAQDVILRRQYVLPVDTCSVDVALDSVGLSKVARLTVVPVGVVVSPAEVGLSNSNRLTVVAAAVDCTPQNVGVGRIVYLPIIPVAYEVEAQLVGRVVTRRLVVTNRTVVVHCGEVGTNWFQLEPDPVLIPDYGYKVISRSG